MTVTDRAAAAQELSTYRCSRLASRPTVCVLIGRLALETPHSVLGIASLRRRCASDAR